jgi:hypothetical protein
LDFLAGWALGQRQLAQRKLEAVATRHQATFTELTAQTVKAVQTRRSHLRSQTLGDLAGPRLSCLVHEFETAASGDLRDYIRLHQVRIIGKRLRYAMEIFAECFAPPFRQALYPMIEQMQDILGRANDSHVALEHLEPLGEGLRGTRPGDWKRYRLGIETVIHYHERRLPRERRAFLRWWRSWETSGGTVRLAAMLDIQHPAAS